MISRLPEGNLIRVYNNYGKNVLTYKANSDSEDVSLESQPAGIYLFAITNGIQRVAQFKIIKH